MEKNVSLTAIIKKGNAPSHKETPPRIRSAASRRRHKKGSAPSASLRRQDAVGIRKGCHTNHLVRQP